MSTDSRSRRPLVSVLTPTFERADFVEGAIRTATGQTYPEVEVVVVDDGSTDDTRAVLEPYEDAEGVLVYHNEENRGIAYSFNRAAAEANGSLFCILGDDDRWHPRKVETQVRRFQALDEEYGVVCTEGVATRDGDVILRDSPSHRGDIYPDVLAEFGLTPHSGHMIRREAFEAVGGFDTSFPRGVDWEMSIRLAKRFKFDCVEEPLVERQLHDTNVSDRPEMTSVHGLIWEKYREEITRYPDVEQRFEANWNQRRARSELRAGRRSDAIRHGWAALRAEPTAYRLCLLGVAVLGKRAYSGSVSLKHFINRFVT